MDAATTRPAKLSIMMFTLVCEGLEKDIAKTFKEAQAAAKKGDLATVERLEARCDALCGKMEALIESQLSAAGEKRPAAPTLAA